MVVALAPALYYSGTGRSCYKILPPGDWAQHIGRRGSQGARRIGRKTVRRQEVDFGTVDRSWVSQERYWLRLITANGALWVSRGHFFA